MDEVDLLSRLGPTLAAAFAERGYTSLTPVQEAALAVEVQECDLRITSQTGSGKTLAIGFALRELLEGDTTSNGAIARPRALVIAPTRELAKQVEEELAWLFGHLGKKVASVTGGSDYRQERRGLSSSPAIVVGTPGRLLDQLNRGSIDATGIRGVALDEADRMLDMGFREELEAIFAKIPEGRRTHLVSATFPRDVLALADRLQSDPVMIEGTPLGAANADIDHVIHLVLQNERLDAIVNLLLASPGAQTLIFARTRADVADLASNLADIGFHVSALSGEMEQRERNRALAAFKSGDLDALVATDVAARGIDVHDIARVIHAEPPMDADSYTHRSGRTGRAGKKGQSTVLVAPAGLNRATFLLRRAGVRARVEPLPTPEAILDARDQLVVADLTGDADTMAVPDERTLGIARRIIELGGGERAIARLLAQRFTRRTEPRQVTACVPGAGAARRDGRDRDQGRFGDRDAARPRSNFPSRPPPRQTDDWVQFRVSWGEAHGADARRLLAMACRRGGIEGSDIGAIRVSRTFSVVDVSARVAASFASAAGKPDPRDPRVTISALVGGDRQVPERPVAERAPVESATERPPLERAPAEARNGASEPATDRRPARPFPAHQKSLPRGRSVGGAPSRPTGVRKIVGVGKPAPSKTSASKPSASAPKRRRP